MKGISRREKKVREQKDYRKKKGRESGGYRKRIGRG